MIVRQLFAIFMVLLLAACSIGPNSVAPIETFSPTLPAGVTPSDTPTPTIIPSPTPTSEVRLGSGDQALFYGDYDRAIREYQAALDSSVDPQIVAAALWGLGRVEHIVGNNSRALGVLWQLTTIQPASPYNVRAYFMLGEIYMMLERYTEAAQAYTIYLALHPGVIDIYAQERRGDAFNAMGNYAEALAAYQAALNAIHITDDTALKIKIGQVYAASGDITSALETYDAIAVSNSNDYVKAQMDLLTGQLYMLLGQPDQAYQRYLHSVDTYPLAYDSYSALVELVNAGVQVDDLNRGLVDYFAGQYGYAMDAFLRYITANPDNDGTAYYYRAMTLRKMGQYQTAVDEFSYFIDNYPQNSYWQAAWDEKADVQWFDLDQYDAAAQTLLAYSSADPGSTYIPQTMLSAGRIYERAGNLEKAALTWDAIADSSPGSEVVPLALFWAGIVRYRSANYDQALVTFQRAAILSATAEDQARAYFWIGKCQQALGDATSAQATWQQTAAIDLSDYYSLRAQDMLFNRPAFNPQSVYDLSVDLITERNEAETWLRVTFSLPADTDLSNPGALIADSRLERGTELWTLGLNDEARLEFENFRIAIQENPADSYRLANYMLNLGLYRPAITAMRQVLTLAGMQTQAQALAAPPYFNHIRYGLYFQELIVPAAEQNEFDPLFLFSVIRQESLFEGFVRSTAGARGLMQIVPATGQNITDNLGWPPNYTPEDLYRPQVSINLGAKYLMNNRISLGGSLYTALAAYNGGPGNALVWQELSGNDPDLFVEVIRYEETRNYIRSIYEIFSMYQLLYGKVP